MAISIFSDEEWSAFVDAIGSPQWAEDQRFATGNDRCRNADALDSFVDSWTVQHTAEDVMGLLQAAGVAAGVVQTGADLSRDPQLKERGFFRRVLDHQGEYRTIESAPYKLSRTPGSVTQGRARLRGRPDLRAGGSAGHVRRRVGRLRHLRRVRLTGTLYPHVAPRRLRHR